MTSRFRTPGVVRDFRVFLVLVIAGPIHLAGAQDRPAGSPDEALGLTTVAEWSGWQRTSTHAEVIELCDRLVAASPRIHQEQAGETFEGRALPLLVIADPPVRVPEDVGDRLVVFAWAGIHSGEVCGKPAILMLARELAQAEDPPLLEDLVVLFLPLLNADGNDRMSPDNRPGQVGPIEGMGTRPNGRGLNINRDFTKLETEEGRAIARVLTRWDPAIAMDLHTTDGSQHRYTITYDGPRNPACDLAVRTLASDALLPAVGRAMEADTGYRSILYGNFNRDRTEWRMYPAQPRYSTHYLGLRHHIGILSEAYSYASYKDRVMATRAFVLHCFRYAAAHKEAVRSTIAEAKRRAIARGEAPSDDTLLALRQESRLSAEPITILGYERNDRVDHGGPSELQVRHDYDTVATLSVRLPFAYLLPIGAVRTLDTLRAHGVQVDALVEDTTLDTEAYRVDQIERANRQYEGHRMVTVEVTAHKETEEVPAGTLVIRTAQPLGSLAAYLLEPLAEDGLTAWNHFDDGLATGADLPVRRVPDRVEIETIARD